MHECGGGAHHPVRAGVTADLPEHLAFFRYHEERERQEEEQARKRRGRRVFPVAPSDRARDTTPEDLRFL